MDRAGGLAALVCAATYIFGFAFLLAVLVPAGFDPGGGDAVTTLDAVAANAGAVTVWYGVIYIVNALALAVLSAALAGRIAGEAPGLGRTAFALGTIWAALVLGAGMVMNVGLSDIIPLHEAGDPAALDLWRTVELIENGLGGGNEVAGAAWATALGIAGLAARVLPRSLSILSLVLGLAGAATLVPALAETAGSIFGLGYILWFLWTGIVLLRTRPA